MKIISRIKKLWRLLFKKNKQNYKLTPKGIGLLKYLESGRSDNEYYEDFFDRFRDYMNQKCIERGEPPKWK
jgi:hypothetical protein